MTVHMCDHEGLMLCFLMCFWFPDFIIYVITIVPAFI